MISSILAVLGKVALAILKVAIKAAKTMPVIVKSIAIKAGGIVTKVTGSAVIGGYTTTAIKAAAAGLALRAVDATFNKIPGGSTSAIGKSAKTVVSSLVVGSLV